MRNIDKGQGKKINKKYIKSDRRERNKRASMKEI